MISPDKIADAIRDRFAAAVYSPMATDCVVFEYPLGLIERKGLVVGTNLLKGTVTVMEIPKGPEYVLHGHRVQPVGGIPSK